jgi:hypothetical protein
MTMGTSTITTNNADILLDGLDSTFVPINSLHTNLGTFAIDHGRNFTTVGSLTNSGFLGIGRDSTLHVLGDLNNSGSVDVNGTLIVDGSIGDSETLDELRVQLLAAYNFGAWNGPGIFSSEAAAHSDSGHPTGLGYADVGGSLVLSYTWTGDTDLNGIVNSTDLANLAMNWSSTGDWLGGDFNYNGIVNLQDLILLAVNWQMDEASLDAALEAANLPSVAVPEPTLLSAVGLLFPLSLFGRANGRSKHRRC